MKKRKVKLVIDGSLGWKYCCKDNISIWIRGYLIDSNVVELRHKILRSSSCVETLPRGAITNWLNVVRGHFAIIIETPFWVFLSVDKIRSIPLLYAEYDSSIVIGDSSAISSISGECLNEDNIDLDSSKEIAMSGYKMDGRSIYNKVHYLVAGECLFLDNNKTNLTKVKYYKYSPWNITNKTNKEFESELSSIMLTTISDMADNLEGRQIVIPLSAGYDSRYIASALKHIGYDNVFCFSYGRSDNFEIRSAEKIAKKLNYPWEPILINSTEQKKIFSQNMFKDFLKYSNTLSSSPVLIDYNAVYSLHVNNRIDSNAVFINGNAGDFITGGHIDSYFYNMDFYNIDFDQIITNYIDKHYSLWECLKTEENVSIVYNNISKIISDILHSNKLSNDALWSVMESIEWSGRQSSLVTMTQRSYEFFDYEWRLPLWDPIFMDFWEGVPLHLKKNQNMYANVLKNNNWGGVWDDIPINQHSIKPLSLKITRLLLKALIGSMGKEKWHKFDKRFFSYFIDTSVAASYTPYFDTVFDRCGARNRNSWITRDNLERHKVKFNDLI